VTLFLLAKQVTIASANRARGQVRQFGLAPAAERDETEPRA
jgi:hypothetical protein